MRTEKEFLIVVLINCTVLGLIGFSCSERTSPSIVVEGETWYKPPEPTLLVGTFDESRSLPLKPVAKEQLRSAIELLQERACRGLSKEQVLQFVGESNSTTGRPFLVRALAAREAHGMFTVFYESKGESLLVFHGSLGRGKVRLERWPIIAWLPNGVEPVAVYTDLRIAR